MLESMTIFAKGGLILYQYTASPSIVGATDGPAHTNHLITNSLIKKILTNAAFSQKNYHIEEGLTFLWKGLTDYTIVALYPDILFEGPRQYLKSWCQALLDKTAQEYQLFYQAEPFTIRPNPELFGNTFAILLQQSKGQQVAMPSPTTSTGSQAPQTATSSEASTLASAKKNIGGGAATSGKEKRNWHDGNSKVTAKAMAELDRSTESDSAETKEAMMDRALREARQAYLPDAKDLEQQQKEDDPSLSSEEASTWSSTITSLFQQLTGNKILTGADLDLPLQAMEDLLTSKNVARKIAQDICQACRQKLEGKRLNSMYRVQTAVHQALESVLEQILNKHKIDVLRNVLSKRGERGLFNFGQKRQPYVISVMGINGIGKTTTIAKLAYFFKQNGCKPLLVAADTFRSGAVEQLQVHAACLEIPLYSQGYAKDPSAVAKAAIQKATDDEHDVVLIDTAGRMQNNVPLMKALTKLVDENKPDLRLLVCEALVGNDGLDQYQMFKQASRGIDGLILTKMDTVADKVGAALTLAHQTGAPIVFCGTGQKYHHLSSLSVSTTVRSLLAPE